MRLPRFIQKILIFVGIARPKIGYMVEDGPDPISGKWVRKTYSPYFELERYFEESGLLVRLVITLGPERVPRGYYSIEGLDGRRLSGYYKDGFVDEVSEIYFINRSREEVSIVPIKLKVHGSEKLFTGSVILQPGKFICTEPLVKYSLIYGTQRSASFEFVHNGQHAVVDGDATRLTVDEVNSKYGAQPA